MNETEALRLAREINILFVSNWGINSPMAVDSKIVLEELHRLYRVEKHLNSEIENHSLAVYEATKLLSQAREQRDELLEALKLALSAHGVMLLSDPPQEAWKTYGVEQKARTAIAKAGGNT